MRKYLPKMGEKVDGMAEALRDQCAVRFSEWIHDRIPAGARKRVAVLLSVSPETVDLWMDTENPKLPQNKHLLAAMALWGPEFAAHVLAPCGEWVCGLSLSARAARVREELANMRRELDEMDLKVVLAAGLGQELQSLQKAIAKDEASLQRSTKSDEGS